MILHFLGDSTYSNKFVEYVSSNFACQEHKFIFISSNEIKYVTQKDNVLKYRSNSFFDSIKIIKSLLKKYKPQKIFLHFLSDLNLFPVLLSSKHVIKYWIVWGGDIYSYVDWNLYDKETENIIGKSTNKKSIKQLILKYIRKIAIKKIYYIGINETEFSIIRKYFNTDAKRVDFKYPNPTQVSNEEQNVVSSRISESSKVILLGNSGDPTNNHISILKRLKNLDCDYKVIVPLSYGSNKKYIETVKQFGSELLGERFVPLMDFMSSDEYSKLLSTVDVGIMNHYRQQAAGNLRILLSQGKKVYLNEINPLYYYYTAKGILLSKIDDCNFNSSIFEEYSEEVKELNKKAIEDLYSQDKIYDYMKELFA